MRECTCPEDHTITKLGHCRTCDYAGTDESWNLIPMDLDLVEFMKKEFEFRGHCAARRDQHHDGTPHDFDWATYADDHESYGVCRCGLDSMTDSLMRFP